MIRYDSLKYTNDRHIYMNICIIEKYENSNMKLQI